MSKHSHYYKDVAHLTEIDVYRVLDLFGVTSPPIQHAIKKLLLPGGRGAGKDYEKDLREAVDSVNRGLQMIAEDCNKGVLAPRRASQPVTATLEVKVDPAAGLLTQAVEFLRKIEEGQGQASQTLRIHARALLRKIESADYKVTTDTMPDNPALTGKPVVTLSPTNYGADIGASAAAQGIDLVTEQMSIARSRMPVFTHRMPLSPHSAMLPPPPPPPPAPLEGGNHGS